MRLLAVDDDVVTHMVLGMELDDVELLEAGRADDGFRMATNESPDAVVIDLRLPDGDGLDLVRRLRHHLGINQLPIVVLTAGHDPSLEADVLAAGADAYLPKPFEARDIEAYVEAILRVPPAERRARRRDSVRNLRNNLPAIPLLLDLATLTPDASLGDARHHWWQRAALPSAD